jgi:AcrR family transcriptional regulator
MAVPRPPSSTTSPSKSSKQRVLLAPAVRRQQLLDAAVWAFARKGFRHAQVSDIIARAGVARGTFYLHFASKQQVFLAIVEDFQRRLNDAFQAIDEAALRARQESPQAILKASFKSWLGFFARHQEMARVMLREAAAIDPRFDEGVTSVRRVMIMRFASRFRRLQQGGMARSTVDPELAAHLQMGMVDELLDWFVLRDKPSDLDELAERLADFEWNGIKPAPD